MGTQAAFDRVSQHRYAMGIAWDRVHPGTVGHMMMPYTFLAALDAGGSSLDHLWFEA